jgi:hypothetical protein
MLTAKEMPIKLATGDTWEALLDQDPIQKNFSGDLLYFELHISTPESDYGS